MGKRGVEIVLGNTSFIWNWDTRRLRKAKYKVLEDMVYRMQLTCDEIIDILDVKYNAGWTKRIYATLRCLWN